MLYSSVNHLTSTNKSVLAIVLYRANPKISRATRQVPGFTFQRVVQNKVYAIHPYPNVPGSLYYKAMFSVIYDLSELRNGVMLSLPECPNSHSMAPY